jgi:hypothetical protein
MEGERGRKNLLRKFIQKINNPDPETHMSRILQILKGKNHLSNIQIACAISICEILLNPKNLHYH